MDVAVRRPDATDDVKRLGESLLLVNARHERLIDGLLALTEGEQTVLDRRPFDLTDVAEHVLDQAAEEAAEHEVVIHRLLDAAPTAGEAVLVERLVQNLVENAIRHNHPKGELWVTTRQRSEQVELVVANTGPARSVVRDRDDLRAVPAAARRPAPLRPGQRSRPVDRSGRSPKPTAARSSPGRGRRAG